MRWARQFAAGAAARRPASRARAVWQAPELAAREATAQPADGAGMNETCDRCGPRPARRTACTGAASRAWAGTPRGRIVLIGDAAHGFPPLPAQGAAMAIEDAVALAESLGRSRDVGQALRSYESRRRPRVETIRAAVRRVTIVRGMEGPVTPELLEQHPPVFSASLKAFDEVIEDPFTPLQGTT